MAEPVKATEKQNGNAVATTTQKALSPIVEVRAQLENMESQFQAALPKHIPVERFIRVVMTAIQNNPDLLNADRRALFNAAMKAAQDGLLPDGREGAMVLRRQGSGFSITWQPMIAGVRKKARNSGEISSWDAHIVCMGDNFEFQLGDNPQVHHSFNLTAERGPIVGAYSVCLLKDGTKSYEVMSVGDIYKIRDRSDAWKAFKAGKIKSTPWSTDEGEMCRKTVAKRHSKVLPMSTDLDDLIRRDDELYNFEQEKPEAGTAQSISSKLDALAGLPSTAPAQGETIDNTTGEVISEHADGQDVPKTAQPSEAGPPAGGEQAKASPATKSEPTSQEVPTTAATGEAAVPSSSGDADLRAAAKPPANEKEYLEHATIWIANLIDVDAGLAQWKAEKSMRNKANVPEELRETLKDGLDKKILEIRDADRS